MREMIREYIECAAFCVVIGLPVLGLLAMGGW
jgi:hypothetical protein